MPSATVEIRTDDDGHVTEILVNGNRVENVNYLRIVATPTMPMTCYLDLVTIKHKKLNERVCDDRVLAQTKILLYGKRVRELTHFGDAVRTFERIDQAGEDDDA